MESNDDQSPIVRCGFAIAAFACVVGGPLSGYFLTKIFLEARASANWPSVQGTVTKAQVGTTGPGRYIADVSYNFSVDGKEFIGTKVRASDGECNIRDGAVQAIRGLSVGQVVPVFYNPADPRKAVLRTGAGFQEYVLLMVPLAMFGIGVWSFRLLWRTRERRFEPQTVVVGELGEATSDRYGFWNVANPVLLDGRKVAMCFHTGERPPGEAELTSYHNLIATWPKAWSAIVEHLRNNLQDDGSDGERERYLRKARPAGIQFLDGLNQWEVELKPDIYSGHVVTMLMTSSQCEDYRLDG